MRKTHPDTHQPDKLDMQRKQKSWLSELEEPDCSDLARNVNYIDNLVGSSRSKTFLIPQKRHELNRKSDSKPKGQRSLKKIQPSVPPKKTIELDDIRWIEERRKKFPKVAAEPVNKAINLEASELSTDMTTKVDLPKATQGLEGISSKTKTGDKGIHRRKTLFEKLLD